MKQTRKYNVYNVLCQKAMLCILLTAVLLWFSRSAQAYNYEGAFYVDSPTAVTTLQNKGFNVFMIPGGLSHATIQSTLAAITVPGGGAIIMLNGFTDAAASDFVYWLMSIPEYSKVLAYNTFSEPNWDLAGLVPLSRQRGWYAELKRRDASKAVIVNFHVNSCGISHKELVDASPGLSWDDVMVFFYPYSWWISDAQAISNLQAGAADVASYFAPGTFIIPLQQAAGCSVAPPQTTPACGEALCLRAPPNAMDQYNVWRNAGCLNTSHALFYYSWATGGAEDQNLQTPGWLDAAAAQITYHKSLYP